MDMASTSKVNYAEESMETDEVEHVNQRKRKNMDDDEDDDEDDRNQQSYMDENDSDSDDMTIAIDEQEANNRSRFERHLPYVKQVISECELRRRKSMKRRRLNPELEEFSDGEDMYDPDDEWSSSSIPIVSDSSDTDPMESPGRKDKIYLGSWLILSFVKGGWCYETVKKFLFESYEVKCIKSKIVSERLAIQENNDMFYQAIARFDTKQKLNLVLGDLTKKKVDDKFLFVSVDKLPLASSCEEWCEGGRFNAWFRMLNEV